MTLKEFKTPPLNSVVGHYYDNVAEAQRAGVFDCNEFFDWVAELGLDAYYDEIDCDNGAHYAEAKQIWCDYQSG